MARGAAQILEGAARDHEQEQVEDAEEGELERDRSRARFRIRACRQAHCSMSKMNVTVPRETSSPGASREVSMRRPLTLTPLVEPRSTICQSPDVFAAQLGVAARDVLVVDDAVALARATERGGRAVEDVAAILERDDRLRLGQRRGRAVAPRGSFSFAGAE